MDNVTTFLRQSPVAEKARLQATVVLNKSQATAADLLSVKDAGVYGPVEVDAKSCELEIGGQVVAVGRIVRRGGRSYFKVGTTLIDEGGGE